MLCSVLTTSIHVLDQRCESCCGNVVYIWPEDTLVTYFIKLRTGPQAAAIYIWPSER